MDWERVGYWAFGLAVVGSFAYVLLTETDEPSRKGVRDAEGAYIPAEGYQASAEQRCAAVTEALDAVVARGRSDLARAKGGVAACRRIEVEDCGYKVELLYELTLAGHTALAQDVGKFGAACGRELEFAVRHGLVAFREHHKLLNDAVEDRLDPAQ